MISNLIRVLLNRTRRQADGSQWGRGLHRFIGTKLYNPLLERGL